MTPLAAEAAAAATAITPDTTVPLTIVYVVIGAVIVGTGLAYGIFYRLGTLNRTVGSLLKHGWTVADHEHWTTQLRDRNPSLHVPKARKIVPVDEPAGE